MRGYSIWTQVPTGYECLTIKVKFVLTTQCQQRLTLGHLVKLEVSIHRPWVNVGPDVIMREAPLRLQNGQSWDKLRPSLAITVRLEVLGLHRIV